MSTLLNRLRTEQTGMSLIELMAAISIGMIVLMAGFQLLDRATSVSQEISDRQEAVQRGRLAMETITRQVRSQVCLGDNTEPISYGDDDTITFYADLGDGSTPVERRTLTYDATAPGRLVEQVEPGSGVYPTLNFGVLPSTSRTVLTRMKLATSGGTPQPVFRYYGFQPGGPTGDLELLPTPLSTTDASRTVMVRVAFVAMPDRVNPRDQDATTMQDDVYVRIADPARPQEGPRCI